MSGLSPQVRRRARERVMQFLFGLDFTQYEWRAAATDFWAINPVRPSVKEYADILMAGVMEHRAALDREIDGALENWTPERVGRIERNILRIALFEMRHRHDVPRNAAISEAVEIAKRYGSDEAPRFVNGVLDRLKGD